MLEELTHKVIRYNQLLDLYDPNYKMSDDHSIYKTGKNLVKELDLLYLTMTQIEKDLVGLYSNHIKLNPNMMPVKILSNSEQEALKYYEQKYHLQRR